MNGETETTMNEKCEQLVRRGSGWQTRWVECGRLVKADGLCGLHLGALKRRESRDAEVEATRSKDREATDRLIELSKQLGNIPLSWHYGRSGRTNFVLITEEDLRAVSGRGLRENNDE